MRAAVTLLAICLCFAYVVASPKASQRVIGGSATQISQYPANAALLRSSDLSTYWQHCGGTILNVRSILTAANCFYGDVVSRVRVRVGSSYGNSGGSVYNVASINAHPNFDSWTHESDVAIIQTATFLTYVTDAVQAGRIAGPNYIPDDNDEVWATGWGATYSGGGNAEQLHHAQMRTINQVACRSRYTSLGWPVTDSMLCAGQEEGIRSQCDGDVGSALYHYGVVVGVYAWGYECGRLDYPGVNTRVSSFTTWIQDNA